MGAAITTEVRAQGNSETTTQILRLERPEQVGTFITLEPPAAALTPYVWRLPAAEPRIGAGLYASGTSPHSSDWTYYSGAIIELATSDGNLRRMGISLAPGSAVAVPGDWALDLQGFRSSASQTASDEYAVILGGSENTSSGEESGVGGGNQNTASGQEASIGGGRQNLASGQYSGVGGGSQNTARSAQDLIVGGSGNFAQRRGGSVSGNGRHGILGGADNYISDYEAVIFGGQFNRIDVSASDGRSFIGGGFRDSLTGVEASLFGGFDNNAFGTNSTVIGGGINNASGQTSTIFGGESNVASATSATVSGGQSNTVAAIGSVISGGGSSTISSAGTDTYLFSAGPGSFSTAAVGQFVINNVDVVFGGSGGGQSTLRFYEPKAASPIGVIGTYNFVELQGSAATTDDLDNTYTLPVAIPTSGTNLLSIMDGATSTAAGLEWTAAPTRPTTTVNTVAPNAATFNIAAGNLNESELLLVNPNNTPANRSVTLANGTTNGFVVTLRVHNAAAANGIRLVAGANLNMAGAGNVDLDQFDTITLVWDATSAAWLEIARSTN